MILARYSAHAERRLPARHETNPSHNAPCWKPALLSRAVGWTYVHHDSFQMPFLTCGYLGEEGAV